MQPPNNLDDEARAELLCYPVVGQLDAGARLVRLSYPEVLRRVPV